MPHDPPLQLHRARTMTRDLRASPTWASFRRELVERGLDADEVVLLDSLDEDAVEAGLLATADHRLIAWRREYDDDEETSRVIEWRDVTDAWASTSWSETAAEYVNAVAHTRPPRADYRRGL